MGRWNRNRIIALIAAVAVTVIFVGGCSGKPKKKPLGELPIDIAAFAQKETRHYALGLNADPKTWDWKSKSNLLYSKSTEILPGSVEIFDTVAVGPKIYNMRLTCKKSPFLEVIRSHVTEEQGGKILDESRVEVKNGQLHQTFLRAPASVIEYPDNIVSQAGLMRIVEVLPREKGVLYTFPGYFDPQEPKPETGDGIGLECMGEAEVKVADRKVNCTLYVLRGVRRESRFYVDAEGVLQFVEMDGGYTRMALLTASELAMFPFAPRPDGTAEHAVADGDENAAAGEAKDVSPVAGAPEALQKKS